MIDFGHFDRYSHGFIFPSIVRRVKREMVAEVERSSQPTIAGSAPLTGPVGLAGMPLSWGQSSVSTFGVRYTPPLPDLSPIHSVEAFVEGSDMSLLREGTSFSFFFLFRWNMISQITIVVCRQPDDA
jgi:hypothetical protein